MCLNQHTEPNSTGSSPPGADQCSSPKHGHLARPLKTPTPDTALNTRLFSLLWTPTTAPLEGRRGEAKQRTRALLFATLVRGGGIPRRPNAPSQCLPKCGAALMAHKVAQGHFNGRTMRTETTDDRESLEELLAPRRRSVNMEMNEWTRERILISLSGKNYITASVPDPFFWSFILVWAKISFEVQNIS